MDLTTDDPDDDEPIATAYRTNGMVWAAFAQYQDGTEEPVDIFGSEGDMLAHLQRQRPVKIEFRPQEIGCEVSDGERAVIPALAAAFDAHMKHKCLLLAMQPLVESNTDDC